MERVEQRDAVADSLVMPEGDPLKRTPKLGSTQGQVLCGTSMARSFFAIAAN